MGRSVLPHPDADVIAYDYLNPDEEWYRELYEEEFADEEEDNLPDFDTWMWKMYTEDAAYQWESFTECIQSDVLELFPSMTAESDVWVSHHGMGAENLVLARNGHSEVSISEYCGVVAISLAPRSDLYYGEEVSLANLGSAWRKLVADKFESRFSSMQKIGTFSNGESVYQKIS